jgi:flavin reductase (DIM6/NTAB) family NADH-FMN oxidoreductase RutF
VTSGDDKWRELRYVEDDLGNVMFPDAAAVFSCTKRQMIESGDHMIVLGEVLGFRQNAAVDPLVYCRSRYCVPTTMPPASPN